ncbi:MAG TPA: PP2C family protein-serine/threonine phosphatase [Thermoguttaceae bacterium]|nr:PP2C family protein-serine/threonine phosphatase [Thermoguttaceae bacterium]
MRVFYEFGLKQMNKKREELCGDSVVFSAMPDWATLVLSDGLGSGVKANILSTLTTRIATRMLAGGLPLGEVVQTLSETLPICRVRKIAYSTFTMAQLFTEGYAKLVVFDNPPPVLVRRGRVERLPYEERDMGGKRIYDYSCPLRPGDWLVLVSDGVLNAGIGGAYPLGWGWEEVAKYVEGHVHDSLSAEDLAQKLARVVEELYEGPPGDDVSIAVVKARWRRVVVVFTGPPVSREDDERVVRSLTSSQGKRAVCGGTTANIVSRQLGRQIDVDLETGTDTVPAMGRIDGIDLVTEGTLTITKALEIIRVDEPNEELKLKVDGASRLVVLLREADEVRILLGRAMNPAHQNPNLPRALGLKTQVVQALVQELGRRGKQVQIEYF